ncbi:transmembrane reductase CYB561D2-like [Aethina tumida]|uniref:transmembrane reductase CYB561D2-like n=1 Tax=Aethina tumida TaxID=116153 RepID=UPI00096B4091|nr:transmembrane reductase CYB561D2-like [Aethina tumida]
MAQTDVTLTQRCLWMSHVLFQQCVAVIVTVILSTVIVNLDINNIGTWHIILCTLGYAFFMAEAIVVFAKSSFITVSLKRKFHGYIHGVLMGCAIICVTIGISLKIYQKSTHFKSNHAITGLVSWILGLVATFGGVAAANAIHFKSFIRPVWIKFFHNFLGIASYSIGMASLALGLYKGSIKMYTQDETRTAMVWVIGILTVYSLLEAFKSLFFQIKNAIFK